MKAQTINHFIFWTICVVSIVAIVVVTPLQYR